MMYITSTYKFLDTSSDGQDTKRGIMYKHKNYFYK